MSLLAEYLPSQTPALFLLRHGHIDTGAESRYVGQTDYPLSPRGREQAEMWHQTLSGISFTEIITSDLQRASETADIITDGRQDVSVLPLLREINLGEWENQTICQVRERYPEAYLERGRDMAGFRPPGGESFQDLQGRVLEALLPILENLQGHILVVGHAGVNRVIICHLLGMPLARAFSLAQDYGALNIIAAGPMSYTVQVLNLKADSLQDPQDSLGNNI